MNFHMAMKKYKDEDLLSRLESGSKRFDKLENLMYGLYMLIISSMVGLLIERIFF